MQITYININGKFYKKSFPDHREFVFKNIRWGRIYCPGTPAYWVLQIMYKKMLFPYQKIFNFNSLKEEIIYCLLGGYGISAETGWGAFKALKNNGIIDALHVNRNKIAKILSTPFEVNKKNVKYRFFNTKSIYIENVINNYNSIEWDSLSDIELRNKLLEFSGIGYKTASWITRNWRASNKVAILDIHIMRMGWELGLFSKKLNVVKNYLELEDQFLSFAKAINVEASILDLVMWEQIRYAPHIFYLK